MSLLGIHCSRPPTTGVPLWGNAFPLIRQRSPGIPHLPKSYLNEERPTRHLGSQDKNRWTLKYLGGVPLSNTAKNSPERSKGRETYLFTPPSDFEVYKTKEYIKTSGAELRKDAHYKESNRLYEL
ncbi:hypothetical protein BgiBS90_023046 [Biomphalaria glabrata]|nr:hypothetical protein BgiBS90_023046 [Biomphalaria glabrata]